MIYLLRHGLDDERFVGGWSDVDLVDVGIRQIHETGKFIKENNFKINLIYTSDIKRSVTTSKIINSYIDVPIIYTDKLRELNKGILTGKDTLEAKREYPNYFNSLDIYKRYPNGESLHCLYIRIKEYLKKISTMDDLLLITHRGVINMIYYLIYDIDLDMNKERFCVDHGSLHELDLSNKTIKKIK